MSVAEDSIAPSVAQSDGPTTVPLLAETVGQKFAAIVRRFGNRVAIRASSRQVSYQELDELSDALATGLADLGIQASDRVAVSLGNDIEYGVIAYACFKIGAILVPLNPAYYPGQTLAALNHISASCLVISKEITLPHKEPRPTTELLNEIPVSSVPSLQRILLIDNSRGGRPVDVPTLSIIMDYDSVLTTHRGMKFPVRDYLHVDDVVNIQFTSGTTSAPKAACLTHRNILNNGFFVGEGMELTEHDIICCPPPLYHCFGLILGLLASMTHGGSALLLPSESFNAEATLKAIERYGATVLYGVPTMFLAELDLVSRGFVDSSAFRNLRTGIIGGSPIPPALRLQLHDKMNLSGLTSCYGLTEASPIVSQTRVSDPLETRLKSVGRVLPHTSIRIAGRDDPYRTLRRGEKGELQIAGYSVMKGYWQAEADTAKALVVGDRPSSMDSQPRSAWLRSGDEALMEDDGTIKITGRIKDVIIRGGENIYPPEIENCLLQHQQITNGSVVGLSDARYGEAIAAFLVVRDGVNVKIEERERDFSVDLRTGDEVASSTSVLTPEEIRSWIRCRLSKNLVPKYIFSVSSMPLTASGKIEKYKLQKLGNRWLEERSA